MFTRLLELLKGHGGESAICNLTPFKLRQRRIGILIQFANYDQDTNGGQEIESDGFADRIGGSCDDALILLTALLHPHPVPPYRPSRYTHRSCRQGRNTEYLNP